MLFLLTGTIQIGKTRWLHRLIPFLDQRGITSIGVLAPGRWTEPDKDGIRDKLGIDNVLLPQEKRISFATRRDLLESQNTPSDESQVTNEVKMWWAISDDALRQVNEHFDELNHRLSVSGIHKPTLLVVDEFGWLELLRNTGLTSALALADRPQTFVRQPGSYHGLFVVRADLIEAAKKRFSPVWGEPRCIHPDDQGGDSSYDWSPQP